MKTWATVWEQTLGFPSGTPEWLIAVIVLICVYAFIILPGGAVIGFLDRKITADLQARVGPVRVGLAGALQPIADLLRLLQKSRASRGTWREELWLGVHTMALYSTVAVLPLGSVMLLVDTDMSAFLPFWAALVLALGTMLLGLNQGSIPGWFGGIRVASQALAGSFPALIAILTAGIHAGGFKWSQLAGAQGFSPLQWTLFSSPPFELVSFLIFVVSGLVVLGVSPLDGGLSSPDIHGGVSSHLHGRRLVLFRLGRFYGFFLWSVIAVVLYLGAWNLPQLLVEALRQNEMLWTLQGLELITVLMKTFLLMLLISGVTRVIPRVRADQVTDFAWTVLSPLSLAALIGAACWAGWKAY